MKTVKVSWKRLDLKIRVSEIGFEVRLLTQFKDYSRREVRDILSPRDSFAPGSGKWGLSGIVEHRPAEFVFFVTFGSKQGEHQFDEGVTVEGVVSWQSQPGQSLTDPQHSPIDWPGKQPEAAQANGKLKRYVAARAATL